MAYLAKITTTLSVLLSMCFLGASGLMMGMGRGGGMGMRGGGMRGRGGMMGGNRMGMGLPPGMAMIDGEVMDMSNKVVQQVGGSAGGRGTTYYSYFNQKGPPLFTRRETDTGRKFVLFPDRNYPPGDGHYIVLRRMKRAAIKRGPVIYEAFYLDLGDSIKAMVSTFSSTLYGGGAGGVGAGGLRGGGVGRMPGGRVKRKTVSPGSHEFVESYEKPRRRHGHQKSKGKGNSEMKNKTSHFDRKNFDSFNEPISFDREDELSAFDHHSQERDSWKGDNGFGKNSSDSDSTPKPEKIRIRKLRRAEWRESQAHTNSNIQAKSMELDNADESEEFAADN